MYQVNAKAWRAALKRVGIQNFRWHDLRHTWTSWHVQAGTPLHVLHELGAWECVEMVRKYAHLSTSTFTSTWTARVAQVACGGWRDRTDGRCSVATFWLHTHKRKRVASLQPVEESGAPGKT